MSDSESAATVLLAIAFYASMAALIEVVEVVRERGHPDVVVSVVARRQTVRVRTKEGSFAARNARTGAGGEAPPSRPRGRDLFDFVWSAALVVVATLVAYALAPDVLAPEDVVMLYVAAIMIAAVRYRRGAALLASTLSVAGYDFFFVPPKYTFSVGSTRHLLTFAMMFAVGIILSTLAHRLKRQSAEAAVKAQSEEMKTALLSAVSHDLRTPLAAITGAATTLREDRGQIADEERAALLDAIADEGFRLERLVANLLDMTRVESGALSLRREWMPVEELVGSALARTEKRLGSRVVRTELHTETPLVHVDPALFELVLVNLLDNAAKHTPSSSTISLSSRLVDRTVAIEVSDDGPGLPANVDVFARFVRGPASGSGGLGLGLAIAKAIVEAHGGTIRAHADANAHGAAFAIALPVETAPHVPEAP